MATDAVTSESRTRRRSSRRPAHVGVWIPTPPGGAIRAAALAGVAVALASLAVGWAPAGASGHTGLVAPMPVGRRALALPEFQVPPPVADSGTASAGPTGDVSAPATVAVPASAAASYVVDRSVETIGSGTGGPNTAGATTDLSGVISSLAADGIPTTAVDAYHRAAARAESVHPGCGIPWALLAGIGRVESDHGRFADSLLYTDGESSPPIIGIPLNGVGTALVLDTDHGRLDGDRVYDRAVGPMQFIPGTWQAYGVDGNGDGRIDPFNIYDAAAAAADYLCTAGGDLSGTPGQTRAILAYNYSSPYLASVLALEAVYSAGTTEVPATPGNAQVDLPVPPAPNDPATTAPSTAPSTTSSTVPAPSARPSPAEAEDPRPSPSRHRPHPSSSAHGSTSPTPSGGDDPSSPSTPTGTGTSGPTGASSEPRDPASSSCPAPSPSATVSESGPGASPSVSLSPTSTAGSAIDVTPTATASGIDIAAAPTTYAATDAPSVTPSSTQVTLPTETITVTVSGTTVVVTLTPTVTASPTGTGGGSSTPGPTATGC